MRQRIIRLLAATLLGVAAGAVVSAGPAAAAACPKGEGITVVVGSDVRCDADGGGPATRNFSGTGHSLESYRGFICRIDGKPGNANACAGYAPADAYWGLFWSNGTNGKWAYASESAGTLDVPEGGWVAFVFQNSASKTYPGMKPLAAPAPTPTTKAKPKSTPKPAPSVAGSATPTPTTSTPTPTTSTKTPKPTTSTTGAASATTGLPTVTPDSSDEQVENASNESDGSSSLAWVAGGLGLLLLVGMGIAVWQRRARDGRQS